MVDVKYDAKQAIDKSIIVSKRVKAICTRNLNSEVGIF